MYENELSFMSARTVMKTGMTCLTRFVFAKNCHETGLLSDMEWSVYCDWHGFLLEALPLRFDGFIYLRSCPKVREGGREGE